MQLLKSILLKSTALVLLIFFSTALIFNANAAPGVPNLSFGMNGYVTSESGNTFSSLVKQADGKILVAGGNVNSTSFSIWRYDKNGVLDKEFGTNGLSSIAVPNSKYNVAAGIALQNNGKILVTGTATNDSTMNAFAVLRLNTDGSLDKTFGNIGYVLTEISAYQDNPAAIAIQSDGKIVVAGTSSPGAGQTGADFAIVRYLENGTLDQSFATSGILTVNLYGGDNGENKDDTAYALALQSDGSIIVAGKSYRNHGSNFYDDAALIKVTSNGTLDPSFGQNGMVKTNLNGSPSLIHSLAIQSDGKILAMGQIELAGQYAFLVMRYAANGSLDSSFGSGGIVSTHLTGFDPAWAGALLSNGKIVLAGSSYVQNGTSTYTSKSSFVKYNADGSLDTTFGTSGKIQQNINSDGLQNQDSIRSIIETSDHGILGVGSTSSNINGNQSYGLLFSLVGDTNPTLTSIEISGAAGIIENSNSQYSASANWADGSVSLINPNWTITTGVAAEVSTGGKVTTSSLSSNQTANLTATYEAYGVSKTASLTISLSRPTLTGLSIVGTCSLCGTTSVNESSTSTYVVNATYANGSTATVSAAVTLDATTYASLSGSTLTTSNVFADQSITLRASYTENGVTKTATYPITVKNSVNYLTGIAINGAKSLASGGANSAYTVTATYDNGTTATVAATLTASGAGAILISGQLMSGSPASTTTVTLSATYTENGVTKTATLPVSITVAGTTNTTTTTASTTTTTVISSAVSIAKGWNLIGAGGNQSFKASSLFGDKNTFVTVWKWIADQGQWAFYAPSMTATALSDYALGKGYQVLDTIQGSDGFWVNASSATSVSLPFGTAYTAVNHRASLRTGWNLVSSGDNLTPVRFNNYLTIYSGEMPPSIGSETTTTVYQDNLTSLWAWDAANSKWYFYAPSLDRSQVLGDYISGKGYLNFTTDNKKLGSGTGFWVNMPSK